MQIPRSTVPGIVTPAIPGRMASLLLSVLYQFEQTQWMTPEELFAQQARQLQLLFAHAAQTVPLYRRRFVDAGVDATAKVTWETLQRLPILTRAELQAAAGDVNAASLPKSHGKRYTIETSGSTGRAVRIFGTEVTGLFWRACVMREHFWQGRDLGGKLGAIRKARAGTALAPAGARSETWGPASGTIYPTGPAVMLNVVAGLDEQVAWLRRERPDYLISFPSNFMALASYCRDREIGFENLKQVMTVGETVTDDLRRQVSLAWDVPLKDSYSCEEAGYLAVQCPLHETYHVQSENVVLEVVDDEGRPCSPGETGRVLVTCLHNFASPLIRYELGDYAEAGSACACGRGLPTINRVLGRRRNRMVLPDGRSVFPNFGYHDDYRAITDKVRAFQYVQRSADTIEKRMVVSEPLTEAEEAAQRALIVKNLGHPFEIVFSYHDRLSERDSGKFEEFVSDMAL
ncbi:hypothetical protein AAFN88_17955 [Pelagibius sp. CAU 1746]|uniref:phenylacetate--CoA ligase family protein n=1 Tax=Pelagibius sp. CAU 1746 TaxID=3140370 RepID=UPI00325BB62A